MNAPSSPDTERPDFGEHRLVRDVNPGYFASPNTERVPPEIRLWMDANGFVPITRGLYDDLRNGRFREQAAQAGPPPLDVERLARAILFHNDEGTNHPGRRCGMKCAPSIAAEYARLGPTQEPDP